MTKREAKDYLEQYRICMAKAQRLRTDMAVYTATANSIKREIEDCESRSSKIEDIISSHKNFMQREVLTRKYIYGDTLEQIAEMLNYSSRHIQRIIDKAAESIGKTLN